MIDNKLYKKTRSIIIIFGIIFIISSFVADLRFLSLIGFFLLAVALLFDLFLEFIDFKNKRLEYANYYHLYTAAISKKLRKKVADTGYTFKEKRTLLKQGIIANIILIFLLLFFVLATAINFVIYSKNKDLASSGNYILVAIYKYHDKYDKYPENLKDLVPEYLSEPVHEDWNSGWIYNKQDRDKGNSGFTLFRYGIGYKTGVMYRDDAGGKIGWEINSEGDITELNLLDPRK